MAEKEDLYQDRLDGEYLGIIEDAEDPLFLCRCKIRVYSKYDTISLDDIPWASPISNSKFSGSNGFGDISVPRKGTEVRVRFLDGNLYQPEYYAIQNISENLKTEFKNSYTNASSLIWDDDENIKIWYSQTKGLTVTCKDSKIQLQKNSTILIEHKDSQSMIELAGPNMTINTDAKVTITAGTQVDIQAPKINVTGQTTTLGPNPIFSALSAEPMWAFINALASAVDSKYPLSPGVMSGAASLAQKASTSTTVKTSP